MISDVNDQRALGRHVEAKRADEVDFVEFAGNQPMTNVTTNQIASRIAVILRFLFQYS